jgi:hypothetical protein
VAELQVEGRLLDTEGRLAGAGPVAGGYRPAQCVQGSGELAGHLVGGASAAHLPPGRVHGVHP